MEGLLARHARRVIVDVIKNSGASCVLDVGMGHGYLMKWLSTVDIDVYGVDQRILKGKKYGRLKKIG
ncbi:MAG TPA: hypothetical protein ENJ93_10275 [Chloroflexi bacterium]|nr:hypothetical protein [Chloroflexota bacterium]